MDYTVFMADQNDVYLTPEQVAERLQLAVETVYRWLRSGKLPGARMSAKAWRVAEHDVRSFMTKQNVSELLFEDYVRLHKLGVPDHEPSVPGKSRRVDYRLPFKGQTLWFEVKEFAEDPKSFGHGGGAYDPYVGIRSKIDKASEKFREYDGECCSLLFYNRTLNLNDICNPSNVLGAMLGNVSMRIPMDFQRGIETGSPSWFFAQGAKLHKQKGTRISAVIALEKFAVGQREFRIALAKKEQGENRRFSWEEFFAFYEAQGEASGRTVLRVLVYENPYANKRLPEDVFSGPYDVRWGPVDDRRINKLYIGSELAMLEGAEHEMGLRLGGPLLQKTKLQPWEDGYQSRKRRMTNAGYSSAR